MPLPQVIRQWLSRIIPIAAVLCLASGHPTTATEVAGSPPVAVDRDFADPDVVKVGDVYHAYATNSGGRHIQHATSHDLRRWTVDDRDVLPTPGAWTDSRFGFVWAPEVFDNGSGFTMQYTARDKASDRQCIGAAHASSPKGPFRPVGDTPLICPAQEGGAIDASSYTENGQRYILWKNDGNCCNLGKDTWLHLQPTSWNGTHTTGDPTRLICQDQLWEGQLVEAPTLVKRAEHYVLLYSANAYADSAYATGYATSANLKGPYTKASRPLMTTDTFSHTVRGPGGQDVIVGPDGRDRIAFHGWSGTRRVMYIADLGWASGYPVVRGSKVIYQAENGHVQHAIVRDAPGASDGRVVGGIDHADSYVEFRAFAASAGTHRLTVWFANGSLDGAGTPAPASHSLTVNAVRAGTTHYPHTGWDKWTAEETDIILKKGWNTLRLSKGEFFAELDSVEIA